MFLRTRVLGSGGGGEMSFRTNASGGITLVKIVGN